MNVMLKNKIAQEVSRRRTRALWGWWDTYPAGAAPLTLSKEQGGTLQHRPRGGPVLPVCHNKTKTLRVRDFRQVS